MPFALLQRCASVRVSRRPSFALIAAKPERTGKGIAEGQGTFSRFLPTKLGESWMARGVAGVLAVLLCMVCGSAHAAAPITIMPMGDSITLGVDYFTNSSGGYRDPLYRDLSAAGVAFKYVGANSADATSLLTSAGQTAHNGFGGWHIRDLDANLDGVAAPVGGGDGNLGGYLLTGGHATGHGKVSPDVILLHIGANDLLQGTTTMNADLFTLVTHIHALSPNTTILVASIVPINSSGFTAGVTAYNTYIRTQLVPSLSYTRYVDMNSAFLNADGSVNGALLGTDNVHPDQYGYPLMAQKWAAALESLEGVTPAAYALSVVGGTGGGAYPAGTIVTIGATTTSGFTSWTPVTSALANPYTALTTYTMPAAATALTANPSATSSSVAATGTLTSGSSSLAATSTDSSTASASTTASGATTAGTNLGTFSVLNQSLPIGNSLVVTSGQSFDGNGMVTYWQTNQALIDVIAMGNGQYEIVEDIGRRCLATAGSAVEIFSCTGATSQLWTLAASTNGGYLIKSAGGQCMSATAFTAVTVQACSGATTQLWSFSGTTPLALSGTAAATPTTVTKTPTPPAATLYALTVMGGTGTGSYTSGTAVAIVADAAPSGSVFAGWTGTTAFLANASSANTTFTMSAASATVTATYTAVPVTPSAAAGKDLGNFLLVNQGNTIGDVMTLIYGRSAEGGSLVGYWQNTQSQMDVLSMGSGQYELIEGTGHRCLTATGSTVSVTTCTAAASQLFTLTPVASGAYTLKSGAGVCVALPGSFSTLVAQTCNASSSSQMWMFSGSTTLSLTN